MDASTVFEGVKQLGLAVIMCLLMAYFVKYMFDKFMDQNDELNAQHNEEITLLKDALNNNTIALTELRDKMSNDK